MFNLYTPEVQAILNTLQMYMDNTKYIILSDTLSAINNIKTKTYPSEIAIFIKNKLDEVISLKNKQISVIPCQTGMKRNEIAD